MKYYFMINPSHGRIFIENTLNIGAEELRVLFGKADVKAYPETLCGVEYICAESANPIPVEIFSKASFIAAAFEEYGNGLLKPQELKKFEGLPDNLNNILKYTGKTNELFTRLLVNLADSIRKTETDVPVLLDPVAGRGTTLFEAAIRGWTAEGVETNDRWSHESEVYFVKYLERGRYKHKRTVEKRSDGSGRKIADVVSVSYATVRSDWDAGDTREIRFFHGDTVILDGFIRKNSVDMIVADLPYGVQHASHVSGRRIRGAEALLEKAIAAWRKVLKRGGSAVLSYNANTTDMKILQSILADTGFAVDEDISNGRFRHRVDQSIERDIIAAIKE